MNDRRGDWLGFRRSWNKEAPLKDCLARLCGARRIVLGFVEVPRWIRSPCGWRIEIVRLRTINLSVVVVRERIVWEESQDSKKYESNKYNSNKYNNKYDNKYDDDDT